MQEFILKGDHIELSQLLKAAGLCETGGMAKMAIQDRLVQVDGVVECRKACKIKSGQTVSFDNRQILIV